jgi:hypothetical protein
MKGLFRALFHFMFMVFSITAIAYFTPFDPDWTLVMATLAWFEVLIHRYEDD